MDSEAVNPYQSPVAPQEDYDELLAAVKASGQTHWRDGAQLVLRLPPQLPWQCLVNNEPVTSRKLTKVHFSWSRGFWDLRGTRTLDLELPIGLRCRKRRRKALLLCGAIAGLGVVMMAGAIVGWALVPALRVLFLVAPLCWLLAAIPAAYTNYPLRVLYATEDFVWLSGVHRELLFGLPDWPAGRPWER